MMRNGAVIQLTDVGICFQDKHSFLNRAKGGIVALQNISMELRRGEALGVIGKNGAGKSTLLRVFSGALTPDTGTIKRQHGSCRLLALGSGFIRHLSGRENAVLNGLILGMERREIVSKLEAVKAFSELGDFFDQPVRTYSSGMRARLGFSVALQQHPDILLVDETLAVGDAGFREKSLAALRDRMKASSTVVIVSHSEPIIRNNCDRAVLLHGGRLVSEGPVDDILDVYNTL